jgi:lipoprotein-anchoring transpeptidase ErfK/SrfK
MHVAARAVNSIRVENEYSPGAHTRGARALHDRAIHHAKGFAAMRTRSTTLLAVACAALLCASHAAAANSDPGYGYRASQANPLAADGFAQADPDGLGLQPGEFTWLPGSETNTGAPVTLLVSLQDQRGYLYRDGRRIAVTTVSTGLPGHDTPTGVFPITEKQAVHHSNKYNNAPMPWMQRLTEWGHALHAGQVRAGPASHGCVRLPAQFAKQLFSLTRRGDLVVISQDVSLASLARAGVDSQVAMMVGASGSLRGFADAVQSAVAQPTSTTVAAEAGATGVSAF